MKYTYILILALLVSSVLITPVYAAKNHNDIRALVAQRAREALEKQMRNLCVHFERQYTGYEKPVFCQPVAPSIVAQCADGVDNDSDGKVDYPTDTGCANAGDNNEFELVPIPAAQCSDGLDNDADGKIDYPVDTGCVSATDSDEMDSGPIASTTPSVSVRVSSSPAAQNVVAGISGFTAANIQFDATQSGEDVRINQAEFQYTDEMVFDVVNCFAYDGVLRLNSAGISPAGTGAKTVLFDNGALVVTKGTVKTVTLRCDIPSTAQGGDAFTWGLAQNNVITGTGVVSSSTVPAVVMAGGQTMTISSGGSLIISKDSSSPTYRIVTGGTTGITLGILRFNADDQDMRLDRLALQLSGTPASSSPSDLIQVTLWDGATQVGTAVFTGTNRFATSTFTSTVLVPANSFKLITIKGDLSNVGVGQAGTPGSLVQVDYDNDDSTGTRAIGISSGMTIHRTSSSDTAMDGVRMFRTIPTIAKLPVPTTTLINGPMDLYRFSVTADAKNAVGLYKFTVNIATTSASITHGSSSVTHLKLFAYSDSGFSSPISGFVDGQVVATILALVNAGDSDALVSSIVQVPAGTTRYFKITGDIIGSPGTTNWSNSVITKISGDSAYPSIPHLLGSASVINADANNNFIWTDNATSTASVGTVNWTNGYSVPGLSHQGTDATTLSR